MLQAQRMQVIPPGKPVFHDELLRGKRADQPKLHQFIGPRSWMLINRLDVRVGWMAQPPNQWDQDPDFCR